MPRPSSQKGRKKKINEEEKNIYPYPKMWGGSSGRGESVSILARNISQTIP